MSEEKKQTVVDIVSELETIADNMETAAKAVNDERNRHDTCRVHPHCNRYEEMMRAASDTRKLAQRINAAFKREVGDITSELNESRKCRDLWSARAAELVKKCDDLYAKLKEIGNAAAMREALEHIGIIAEAMDSDSGDCNSVNANTVSILNLVRAALTAPARNCDLYNNVEDSWQDYKQFRIQTGEAVYFDMVHFWPFAKWLLAPAAERKGE